MEKFLNLSLSLLKKIDFEKKSIEKKYTINFRRDSDSVGQYLEI